ncbi:MAG: DUF881 domain-containing protein [Candidatus Nanopelagicales bacterium]
MPAPRDPAASMALLTELVRDDAAQEYAEAARRHRGQKPDGPTRALFLLACALVAGVLALAVAQRQAAAPEAEKARQALVQRVEQTQADIAALEADVEQTRADLAAAQEVLLAQSAEGAALSARLARLESAAGYTAVEGPGVVVVLDSADGSDPAATDDPGRVLDKDVQNAVNALWASGAEAVAVNGVRLTSTTAIRSAGAAILVDFRPLLPPYRVEAIGDPAGMARRFPLTTSGAELDGVVQQFGVKVTLDPADMLTLPASTALLPVRARVPGRGAGTVAGTSTGTADASPGSTASKETQP